jgi:hypothetical protein
MMKIRTLAVQAAAVLALCGLFAASASADQSDLETPRGYAYAFCGPAPSTVAAWYDESHSLSEWEEHEAWEHVERHKWCAVIVAELTEPEEVTLGKVVRTCVAKNVAQPWNNEDYWGPTGEPWTEAQINAIEQCVEANGFGASSSHQDRGAKHKKHKKHSKGKHRRSNKRKQHRRPPSRAAALAR